MPRSFLIKRMEKVSTGYFPWNEKTLVQGCCSEYRLGNSASMINVKKEFNMKENAMNEARDVDVETEEDAFTENEGGNLLYKYFVFTFKFYYLIGRN